MPSVTLTERDEGVLERLSSGPATVETLAADVPCRAAYLRTRLPALADNGVVEREGGEKYAITPSGRRALSNETAGVEDGRPDTAAGRENGPLDTATARGRRLDVPDAVERRIQSLDLRPDRAVALRRAVAFLHFWGEAHWSEIADAVYREEPAGFETPTAWWTDFVRDRLAALPLVERPDDPDEPWRYAVAPTAEADEATRGADGRAVATDDGGTEAPSVRYAIERSDLTRSERAATRAAFAVLLEDGPASVETIRNRVSSHSDAGDESGGERWTDAVREALQSLPGVERVDEDTWRYRPTAAGPTSTDPGVDVPDGPP